MMASSPNRCHPVRRLLIRRPLLPIVSVDAGEGAEAGEDATGPRADALLVKADRPVVVHPAAILTPTEPSTNPSRRTSKQSPKPATRDVWRGCVCDL
jgi:hypothetical protein